MIEPIKGNTPTILPKPLTAEPKLFPEAAIEMPIGIPYFSDNFAIGDAS